MLKVISIREVILFGVSLILAYFAFVKKWDNSQLQEGKVRAEERVKVLEREGTLQHLITDSLTMQVEVIKGVLEYQKENPKIIIQKYDKIRDNVNLLGADESISFLSDRLSKESGH